MPPGKPNATTQVTGRALDQVVAVTDAQGNTTTLGYDKVGNETSVMLPMISATAPAAKTAGISPATSSPSGSLYTYSYNALNEMTASTNPLGQTTTYGYNAVGEQTSVTDPLGNVTATTYDAQGRPLTVTAPNGGVTKYAYDLAGNQTSITDPVGNVTSYTYNAANELTTTTNPQGYTSSNTYNAAGELTSATDYNGHTIAYAYNANGQETSQTWVGGNYMANYGYNADGELSSASDPFSTYTYTYNALGQQTSVSNAGTPGVPAVTLSSTYDSFGNRTGLSDSLGGNISYAYNADNQLTSLGLSVNGSLDAQVTMAYDNQSNLTGLTRTAPSANGDTISTSYSYDQANELTNITHMDATKNTALASYSYGYNAGGQLTSYQDNAGNSLTYGYDANGELTSATGMLAGSNYSFTYNYDLNGNRTSTSSNIGGSLTSATYTTGTGNQLLNDGTYSYTYDKNGNTLTQTNIATGSVTYYSWDYENRLTEVKVENGQGQVLNDEKFTYDMFGNRIGVSLNGIQTLYTVYDGSNPYMDFNGSSTLTERYLTNPNALSQFYGQVSASGTTQWFLTDNLNSIRQVVNTTGTALDVITYDPFGNIVGQTNAANAPRFLYAGGAYDPITGTYLDGKREENPLDGRWENPDPSGLGPDSNPYRYVTNDPTMLTDPTGLADKNQAVVSWVLSSLVIDGKEVVKDYKFLKSTSDLLSSLKGKDIKITATFIVKNGLSVEIFATPIIGIRSTSNDLGPCTLYGPKDDGDYIEAGATGTIKFPFEASIPKQRGSYVLSAFVTAKPEKGEVILPDPKNGYLTCPYTVHKK